MKVKIISDIPVRIGKELFSKGAIVSMKKELYSKRPELYEIIEDEKPVAIPKPTGK